MRGKLLIIAFVMSFVQLQAQSITSTEKLPEVAIEGTGEIIMLLIPCMSCRWNEWEEFMERNSQKYTMYAITPPGFGGTQAPEFPGYTENTPYRDYLLSGLSELIDEYDLEDLTVVGHSWGVMVGVELSALRKDAVSRLISVDGTIKGASLINDLKERLQKANENIKAWENKLQDPEEWFKFNSGSIVRALNSQDSISSDWMMVKIKLFGSFMATDKNTMLQSWRENFLSDLSSIVRESTIPILDIQSFTGKNQKEQKVNYLAALKEINVGSNVKPVFMYDTKHFIMFHRPHELDCIIDSFMNGKSLKDYAPAKSEYFEEEMTN